MAKEMVEHNWSAIIANARLLGAPTKEEFIKRGTRLVVARRHGKDDYFAYFNEIDYRQFCEAFVRVRAKSSKGQIDAMECNTSHNSRLEYEHGVSGSIKSCAIWQVTATDNGQVDWDVEFNQGTNHETLTRCQTIRSMFNYEKVVQGERLMRARRSIANDNAK